MGFTSQEYWTELPFPSPGDLLNPGMEPMSPALAGRFFTAEPPGKPIKLASVSFQTPSLFHVFHLLISVLRSRGFLHNPSSSSSVPSPVEPSRATALSAVFLKIIIYLWLSSLRHGLFSSCSVWVSHCSGFSWCRAWALGHPGSSGHGTKAQKLARGLQSTGSADVAHGLGCSTACGVFPDQGSNPSRLHWQVFFTTEPPGKTLGTASSLWDLSTFRKNFLQCSTRHSVDANFILPSMFGYLSR